MLSCRQDNQDRAHSCRCHLALVSHCFSTAHERLHWYFAASRQYGFCILVLILLMQAFCAPGVMSAGCTVLHSGMVFAISASARACSLLHLMADANMRCLLRTWSSTLLQSSNEVFTYGISGAFWYAAGAVLQVRAQGHPLILFCTL